MAQLALVAGMVAIAFVVLLFYALVVIIIGSVLGADTIHWALKRERLAEFRPAWICRSCGYDLRGLVEARCPECGTDTYGRVTSRPVCDGVTRGKGWSGRGSVVFVLVAQSLVSAAQFGLIAVVILNSALDGWVTMSGAAAVGLVLFGPATLCALTPVLMARQRFSQAEIAWLIGGTGAGAVVGGGLLCGLAALVERDTAWILASIFAVGVVPASAAMGAWTAKEAIARTRSRRTV